MDPESKWEPPLPQEEEEDQGDIGRHDGAENDDGSFLQYGRVEAIPASVQEGWENPSLFMEAESIRHRHRRHLNRGGPEFVALNLTAGTLINHMRRTGVYDYNGFKDPNKIKDEAPLEEVEEVLDVIFPPAEYVDEDGRLFLQAVSPLQILPEEMSTFTQKLLSREEDRHIREKGICPIREELYSDIFDEALRQVIVECPTRGLLLHRIREELRMTLGIYRALEKGTMLSTTARQGLCWFSNYIIGEIEYVESFYFTRLRMQIKGLKMKIAKKERRFAKKKRKRAIKRYNRAARHREIHRRFKQQLDKLTGVNKPPGSPRKKKKDSKAKDKESSPRKSKKSVHFL